jgi:16S rRNA (guanine966-N2)-methyltransferase
LRIVAGTHRGHPIKAPRGGATRPTADQVRESIFNLVGPLEPAPVLDLFAGSGALGLEALSRGATQATLVDRSPRAAATIHANLLALGMEDRARVVVADWRRALAAERAGGHVYGVVMLDPPYRLLPRIAESLGTALLPLLAPGAVVVVEHDAKDPPPPLEDLPAGNRVDRIYGGTGVSVIRIGAT